MRPLSFALILALAGCATDDRERPGTWRPSGANDINLRAMVADPGHLRAGVAAAGERALPATQAIRRLNTDRRRPLPDSRTARFGAAGGGAAPAAPGGS